MKIILTFNKGFYLTPYEETVMIRRLIILLLVVGCEYGNIDPHQELISFIVIILHRQALG